MVLTITLAIGNSFPSPGFLLGLQRFRFLRPLRGQPQKGDSTLNVESYKWGWPQVARGGKSGMEQFPYPSEEAGPRVREKEKDGSRKEPSNPPGWPVRAGKTGIHSFY